MYRPNLTSVREIIAIEVLGRGREPQSTDRGSVGVEDGTVRKSVGEFLWPSIVTFPLSLRV